LNKSSFFTETENFVRRSLLLTLASIVLSVVFATNVTQSQTSEVNAHITYNKIAKNWIQKGYNQYNEGLYEEAEKSLSQAQSYDEYLNSTERKVLDELLDKTRTARYESKRVSDTYKLVASLIKQGKLTEAKAHLKRIKEYKSLSKKEQAQIDEAIKKIDIRITPENAGIARDTLDIFKELGGESSEELKETEKSQKLQENEIANLYYRSIGLYRTGQLEKARKGFVTVINSGLVPESMVNAIKKHVKKIDETMARRTKTEIKSLRAGRQPMTSRSRLIVPRTSGQIRVARPQAAAPVTGESSYIEVANRKRNILKGHTKAVVDDAVTKTHIYINQGEFDKAQEVVASAEFAVNKNQMYLGEIHYKQYIHMLQQLSKKIDEAKNESTELEDLMKREAAIASQRKFRKQMEMEKEERIKTLMKNARAYQRQQRYEAALGALKSLLAIDPQNDDALILKDTLEDTIYFKRQLEVEKDSGKQRADILLKTDEAGVPYADEIRYPKNWKEIIAKPTRQPDEPIGLDPADVAVYQQLDTVVDLSELTPTMPLGEAIEIIKNSVKPQLNIIPLWRDLYDRAQIDQTTQINMDGLPAIRLVTGLEYLLKAVSGGFADLGYVVENGVITIATIESLPSKLETRVYDITDLLGEPASFFQMPTMMGFGGGGYGGGGGGYGGGGYSRYN